MTPPLKARLGVTVRALAHRNFRLFFFGQLISVTGTWMQSVAQGWLLITLVGPSAAIGYLGLLGICQFSPMLVLGLFGGIIADVLPKRTTVIATQAASGILALILSVLVFSGTVQIWHILVLGFALGLVNSLDMPTRQAFVSEMAGPEDLPNAIALNSAVFNSARVVGPAIGGLLIAAIGTGLCFALNGLSYGAVVLCLLAMREDELHASERLARPRSAGEVRANLTVGLRYIATTPTVALALVVVGLVATFGMNFNVVLPVYAAGILHAGPEGLGGLYSAIGAGALVSAVAAAALARPRLRLLVGGALVFGVAELALAATSSYMVALVAAFFAGLGSIITAVSANSIVQTATPGPLRGRVMGVYAMTFSGTTPIGNGLTGAIGGALGVPAALVFNGLISALAGVGGAVVVLRSHLRLEGTGRTPEAAPKQE
jgi:MFS family permease